jgi:hypothetical protein
MERSFDKLRERLLRAGIAPRHVRRYLAELTDHWADLTAEEQQAGRSRADAESAALTRLGEIDRLAKAIIDKRQFQSISARAPWLIFGLVPLCLLASAYCAAFAILWSGWKIFLPDADTPFVRIDGLAILYFGAGRWLYYGAPIFIGWGIAFIAIRQRFTVVWPLVALILLASIGGMVRVHAGRAVPGGVRQISMGFIGSLPDISYELLHVLIIFSLTALPYLIWRIQKLRRLSA